MTHIFVPVVDQHRHPLMPTTPARARRWLKSGKATSFWQGGIFCVRLNVEPSACATQPIAVGIDPESLREGYSAVSAAHTYLNIHPRLRPLEHLQPRLHLRPRSPRTPTGPLITAITWEDSNNQ